MKTIRIDSVDTRLDRFGARSVLLVCQTLERYKEIWNENDEETLLKLRNREDSFVARAAKKGVKVMPIRHSDLTEERVRVDGPFDFVVIAGEITYQSFSIAARARGLMLETEIAVEFCESTYNEAAHKLIVKNARHHHCEDLLEALVYLTASPKGPRVFLVEK
jgi:hypothetical protein